jgi:predicted DNA-binding transcriptional regulator AlpA
MAVINEKRAAEMMGISTQTLRNKRSRGIGPDYLKLGKTVRYRPEAVERYLEEHTIRLSENG